MNHICGRYIDCCNEYKNRKAINREELDLIEKPAHQKISKLKFILGFLLTLALVIFIFCKLLS